MKHITNNILPILLLAFAAFLVILDKDGWGWCLFGAGFLYINRRNDEKA